MGSLKKMAILPGIQKIIIIIKHRKTFIKGSSSKKKNEEAVVFSEIPNQTPCTIKGMFKLSAGVKIAKHIKLHYATHFENVWTKQGCLEKISPFHVMAKH